MEKYNSGKIYKLVNTIDDKIYIGSTTSRLCDRMSNHRTKARNPDKQSILYQHMKDIGVEHFKIILIKAFPCNSKDELEAEEYKEMSNYEKNVLLNDNTVYKKRSENHNNKVAEAQKGEKSHLFHYGSVFKRNGVSKEGYSISSWCFQYTQENGKFKRVQFSIKKYGDEQAKEKALQARKEIYPNCSEIVF